MAAPAESDSVRLAELVATLSYAADLGLSQPCMLPFFNQEVLQGLMS